MKKLLLYCLMFVPLLSFSQTMKERRVYYLDCTGSMVKPHKLWNPVRNNLKMAIASVNDATTELMVIPFKDENTVLTPCIQRATPAGKKALCDFIDSLKADGQQTLLNIPIEDFYKNRVSPNKNCITYMFLMTDGEDEKDEEEKVFKDRKIFEKNLAKWRQMFADKPVYGFYVMLIDSIKDKDVKNALKNQPHLWEVNTAAIDINLLRLGTKAVYNVRNDKYVDIPIWGDPTGINFNVSFTDQTYYNVAKTELKGCKLRVWIVPAAGYNKGTLPKAVEFKMNVSMIGAKPFTYLVTDKIDVICKNEKEYALKVSVR